MFPSMFGNDPYFLNPNGMDEYGRMMNGFHAPLFDQSFLMPAPTRWLQLDNGIGGRHHSVQPFTLPIEGIMRSMNMLGDVDTGMQRGMMTPNTFPSMDAGHFSSSSSSTVYMRAKDGTPRVIHSSTSSRVGADGVKETLRSHKDSGTGEMSMAIGHHIDDRAHIIEKTQNRKTGDKEEKQEYINIEEEEAGSFNEEWMRKMPLSSAPAPPQQHAQQSIAYHHPSSSRHVPYDRHQQHYRRRPHTAASAYSRPAEQPEPKHRRYEDSDNKY